jgi:aminoglycoside phosphotransferase (APT) family kinase protein
VDELEVRRLVAELFGVEPRRAERMPYGHAHVTYDVALPDRDLIVRTDRRPGAMGAVEPNLSRLRSLGLPVPRVVAADLSAAHHPGAYLVLEKIPGRDLGFALPTMTHAQMTSVATQVVDFQRRAATLPPGRGYGWVAIDAPGQFPIWTALIERDLRTNLAHFAPPLPPLAVRLEAWLAALRPLLDAVPPTPFLDDLTTKNVIVDGGELRGVVDFDCICYGDPLYWLALARTAVRADCPASEFYADELDRLYGLTPAQKPLLDFYTALFHVQFLPRCGPTTFARLVAAAEELVP